MTAKKKDFASIVVDKRRWIEKLFIVLMIISTFMIFMVEINYDLTEYLPDSCPTGKGLSIIENEFGYPGTAQIMIDDVTLYEAKQYKDAIAAIKGVNTVSWIDSFGAIYQSESFIDYDNIDHAYKDRHALMTVIFEEGDTDPLTHQALDDIDSLLKEKGHIIGSAMQSKSLKETVFREVSGISLVVIILIFLVLSLSTTSWLEPLLFMGVMVVAVILNKGTDLFIGEISFLTMAISAVLQLAVATDYSIFLFHAFARHKSTAESAEEAMTLALRESSKSIVGSGMTTFVGFLVLSFMEFTIGYDLGLSMAKGIIMCILCVVLLMPGMILRSYKWIEKAEHRSFMPKFNKTSKRLYKSRDITLVLVLLLIIPLLYAQSMTNYTFGMDNVTSAEGTDYYKDEQAIQEIFEPVSPMVILTPRSDMMTERLLVADLDQLPYVDSILSLADMLPENVPLSIVPKSLSKEMYSDDYQRIIVNVATSRSEGEQVYNALDEIKATVHRYYPEDTYILGAAQSTQDMEEILTRDYPKINRLSIIGILLVMAVTFRSLLLPLIAIVPIESAVLFNMAMPYFTGMKIMYLGVIMIGCVLIGATVDYSILMTNTYLDFRKTFDKKKAAIEAIRSSMPSILTSGTVLFSVGYTIKYLTTVPLLKDLGLLVGRGGILGMLFVLILLPGLLTLFDRWIFLERALLDKVQAMVTNKHSATEDAPAFSSKPTEAQ